RDQARAKGIPINELFSTLQVYFGSLYVNDFNRFGRTWQVVVQADGTYRQQLDGLKHLRVRNTAGEMVNVGSLLHPRAITGPVMVFRYNLYPAVPINATPAAGFGSTEAIAAFEKLAESERTETMQTKWTELALLQLRTGDTAQWVFVLAVVL